MKQSMKILFTIFYMMLFSAYVQTSDASIVLRMQDMNHEPIKQAMCQAPFILQVELKNIEGYTDIHQYIPGIENFKSSQSMTSHNVSIDNGKKSSKIFYNFVLRADKPGNFTVGPIVLKDKVGQHIRSNRFIIPVGDEIIEEDRLQQDKYFITMSVDKKQAFVGEKVQLHIKFYDRVYVDDLHLQFPEFKHMHIIKSQDNLKKSVVTLEGQEYSLTEWSFDVYPTQAGTLLIQDIQAAFFAPELGSKFSFGGAFDFFRSLHKSEQYIIAKPVKIEVLSLPKIKNFEDVTAVGQFTQFKIMINQNSAPVGQGIVLSAELLGQGNFEMMSPLQLMLPKGFRYYDSNMVTIAANRTSKRAEFIVQADEPGVFMIPAQEFLYFDPTTQQYRKLLSNELTITITPAEIKQVEQNIKNDMLLQSHFDNSLQEKTIEDFAILPYHKQDAVQHISFVWYQRLLVSICLLWILLALYRYGMQQYIMHFVWWKKFTAFTQARWLCKKAAKHKNMHALVSIFGELFSQLLHVPVGTLQDTMIITYLEQQGFTSEEIIAWQEFYAQILQSSFGLYKKTDEALWAQAEVWIEALREKA